MHMETTIPCTPTGVEVARDAVAAHLPPDLDAYREDARLLTSEAVTNALRHSGCTVLDSIALRMKASDGRLLIEVEDPGRGFTWPQDPARRRSGPGGYGLRIVDEIAEEWGVRSGPPTVVWFELLTPHRSSG